LGGAGWRWCWTWLRGARAHARGLYGAAQSLARSTRTAKIREALREPPGTSKAPPKRWPRTLPQAQPGFAEGVWAEVASGAQTTRKKQPRAMADEPTRDTKDGDESQHLAERWRADPQSLRQAIRDAREAYQRSPKAAPRLPDTACLVGESKGGTVLYGLVVADAARASEFFAELQETAVHIKSHAHRREARIQVFVPPDWPHEVPTSVAGVRVHWFRWVPVSEDEILVEKLAADSGANAGAALPGESVIGRLLGHLVWWEQALRDGTGPETPYRRALLVYNAATLLEWHFTAPGKDPREHFQDVKARDKAGKVIREFIDAARECVAKTEGVTGAKADKQLGKLAGVTARAVRKLAKLYQSAATPGRCAEFELPLKPAALISAWVAANAGGALEAAGRDQQAAMVGTRAGNLVLQSLAPALAAEKLFDEGKLTAEGYTAVRQTCAEFLEDAVTLAAEETRGKKAKKRSRQVGRPVAEALRRPVAPLSGEGES
jgi:hypothetical protein